MDTQAGPVEVATRRDGDGRWQATLTSVVPRIVDLTDGDRGALLDALDYDLTALTDLMAARGWTTVDLVWRETETRFHARNPFPPGGVVEDPATGAAAAALGGYLREGGHIRPPSVVTVLQGVDMGRPSALTVSISTDPTSGIDVTGHAVALPPTP